MIMRVLLSGTRASLQPPSQRLWAVQQLRVFAACRRAGRAASPPPSRPALTCAASSAAAAASAGTSGASSSLSGAQVGVLGWYHLLVCVAVVLARIVPQLLFQWEVNGCQRGPPLSLLLPSLGGVRSGDWH